VSGWIKLYRDIEDHWIFKDSEVFKRWVHLLMMANFEESKVLVGGNVVVIEKGQMILSQQNMAEKWNISRQTLRTFLNHLEKDGMISRDFVQKTNHKITILTICNYSKYQDSSTTNQPLINHRATTEQPQSNQIKESKELKEGKETDMSANTDLPSKTKKLNGVEADEIFNFWKETMGHPRAVLDPKRKKIILGCLKSGKTIEDIKQAIVGCSLTPFNMGENDSKERYDQLHTILKTENIDRFVRKATEKPKSFWDDCI
jgi:DNA-binding transcriptional regulator YhcF (GntR family)